MLRQLIYQSAAPAQFDEHQLDEIGKISAKNNQQLGITGILLFDGEAFFQVLEGESEVIYPLYEKIKQDARHRDIVMIMDTVIHRRGKGCRTLV